MIHYRTGTIFEYEVDAIVNPVNCVGVMGAGLALAFRTLLPQNYVEYRKYCDSKLLKPGRLFVTSNQGVYKHVVNFATKDHFQTPSKLEWVQSGLEDLVKVISDFKITSIAVPALGAGLGGLNFEDVQPLIEKHLGNLEGVDVYVYLPK